MYFKGLSKEIHVCWCRTKNLLAYITCIHVKSAYFYIEARHNVTVVFNMWLTAGSWGVADVSRDVGDNQQQRVPSGD